MRDQSYRDSGEYIENIKPKSNFDLQKNNIYESSKSVMWDIEDILAEIDVNIILDYVRYIVAAVLISISIVIVLDTFIFTGK